MLPKSNHIISLDLGNLNSRIAVYRNENVEIIPNRQGNLSTPSVVSFTNETYLIGDQALNKLNSNPQNTIYSLKQLIDCDFNEAKVRSEMRYRHFKIVNKTKKPMVQIDLENETRIFEFEEILALIIQNLIESAENYLNEKVDRAVITIPDFFNLFQIQSIQNAAKIAGLDAVRFIRDTAATSVIYSFRNNFLGEKNVFFFDLGSGSLKLSLITIEEGVSDVKTTVGEKNLGGDDFDIRLLNYCIDQFNQQYNLDITKSSKSVARLKHECEKAKRVLSTNLQTKIEIDSLYQDKDFVIVIKRKLFEELCEDLFQRIEEKLDELFENSKINKKRIYDIVVVGGSSRIPKIEGLIKKFFNKSEIDKRLNKEESVVWGCAVYAAVLSGKRSNIVDKFLILDATPLAIGIQTAPNSFMKLIDKNTTFPIIIFLRIILSENGYEIINVEKDGNEKISHLKIDNNKRKIIKIFEGEEPPIDEDKFLCEFELFEINEISDKNLIFNIKIYLTLVKIYIVLDDEQSSENINLNIEKFSLAELNSMSRNVLEYKREYDLYEQKLNLKNQLEALCLEAKDIMHGDNLNICDKTLRWLDECPSAEISEYKKKIQLIKNGCLKFKKM